MSIPVSETDRRPWYVKWRHFTPVLLTTLIIADLVSAIETSMLYAAFKSIIDYTGDPIGAGWIVSVYFAVAGPAALVAGRLGDMYGRKSVLMVVLAIVFAGSVVSGVSHDLMGIVIGRGLQGVSGAIIPLCVGIYREHTSAEKLGVGLGVLLSSYTIGGVLGLILGGIIVDLHHWRAIFAVAAGFAVLALVMVLVFAPSSSRRVSQQLDWLGLGVAPAIGALLLGISSLNSPVLSVIQAVGIIVASLLLLALWAVHELRHDAPLVDLRAFKNRDILLANLTSVVTSLGPSQITLYQSLILQQPRWTGVGFGISAARAGLWKIPAAIIDSTLGAVAGHTTTKMGPKQVILAGALFQTVGWGLAIFVHNRFWPFIMLMFLCSAGSMITNVGIVATVTMATPKEKTGEAMGTVAATRNFGNAVGAQLMALLLSLSVIASPEKTGKSFPDAKAHTYALMMVCLFAVATLLVALAIRGTPTSAGLERDDGTTDVPREVGRTRRVG